MGKVKKLRTDLSEKESEMFEQLGFKELIDLEVSDLHEMDIYRMAVYKVFIEDMKGPAVESLRRTFTAFSRMKPYRMTPEFDALIQL